MRAAQTPTLLLQVRSSSPSCRFTDPRALLSGNFLPNNFAGPRLEGGPGGQLASWWVIDLGPGHSLVPNYYTLRHDGSLDFLRNWVLQVCGVAAAALICRAQIVPRWGWGIATG